MAEKLITYHPVSPSTLDNPAFITIVQYRSEQHDQGNDHEQREPPEDGRSVLGAGWAVLPMITMVIRKGTNAVLSNPYLYSEIPFLLLRWDQ